MIRFCIPVAAGLGFILSAETLVILGNGVGRAGGWFLGCIALAAGLHLLGAKRLFGRVDTPREEADLLRRAFGRTAAVALPLAARAPLTLMAATGLLAGAGYAFNEIFLYWFPNFLFAFLLLGVVSAVNLAGGAVWAGFQILAAGTALGGILLLTVAGLATAPPEPLLHSAPPSASPWPRAALGAVLLVLTYDLAFLARGAAPAGRRSPAAAAMIVVGAGSVLLILWGLASLRWVAPETLAVSTLPHTVTARSILGQEGRLIMGVVLVAGTAAAVNALFGGIARMAAGWAAEGLLPSGPRSILQKERWIPILPAVATALMLMGGVAGSHHIGAFLHAGLLLWLTHHAVLHLAALRVSHIGPSLGNKRAVHWLGGAVLGLAAAALLLTHEAAAAVILFMAGAATLAVLLGSIAATRMATPTHDVRPNRPNDERSRK